MKPQLLIAQGSGFCMGVENAFNSILKHKKSLTDLYLYGNLVHNRFVVQRLKDLGIFIIDDLNEILSNPNIKNVIIRAHGIAPQIEAKLIEAQKNILDLTCPIVKNVQQKVSQLAGQGKTIIIFGKRNHPETLGLIGYCRNIPYFLIEQPQKAAYLPFHQIKEAALISQTTKDSLQFEELSQFLETKISQLTVHNTLCRYPRQMQQCAIALAQKTGLMLVIGDKNSSNTKTLFERVKPYATAYFIETTADIDLEQIKKHNLIGLAGGTSTPFFQINEVCQFLKDKLARA